MRNPPSLVRSGWLRKICNSHRLTDPFRALHPTLRDFTFIPTGARSNRSRLDFFLVYDELLPLLRGCNIKENQQIKILDHKPVLLDFTRNKIRSRPFINRTIINNPRTDDVVLAAIYDTYLQHAVDCEANTHLLCCEPQKKKAKCGWITPPHPLSWPCCLRFAFPDLKGQ